MTDHLAAIEHRINTNNWPQEAVVDLLWLLGQLRIAWDDADQLSIIADGRRWSKHTKAVQMREAL